MLNPDQTAAGAVCMHPCFTNYKYPELQSIKYCCSCMIGLNWSHDWIFPNFQNGTCCKKYLKCNKHNILHMARKYALDIFALGHYLFIVFLELHSRKTVRFLEQIMSAGKYRSIFLRQMELLFIYPQCTASRSIWIKSTMSNSHHCQSFHSCVL